MTPLTRSFKETVVERLRADPAFRVAMVEETARNFFGGDFRTALSQVRDVVDGTMGMEALADTTGIPLEDLVVILHERGNPDIARFMAIVRAVSGHLGVRLRVSAESIRPVGNDRAA